MTIEADDGAVDVVGVGVAVGVRVGVAVAVAVGVGVAESVNDGVGEVVSEGMTGSDAPASVSEVRNPPETTVAAVSAVIRAVRRQSPVLTGLSR